MPIKTNLNVYPYYDDYDPNKDFYRVLFKPGVSVQMRELNQLQTILQAQIERFGDNVFKRGTIISGCNFQFYTPYPYVKLPDTQTDGTPVTPDVYLGKFALDEATGLKAYITNYVDGYELSDPDLKTIYVTYVNSGTSGNTTQFTQGNTVTIFDGNYSIYKVDVVGGGSGFSNNDTVVITPAMVLNVASGITTSDNLLNPSTGANVEIVSVDTTSIIGKTIVSFKPRNTDLTNTSANSVLWSFNQYDAVTTEISGTAAVIEQVYGNGAVGRIVTNGVGAITDITVTAGGSGYLTIPQVSIKTSNSTAQLTALDLRAKNYIAKIKIPTAGDSVGNGYAFGLNEGVIYQTGHFLRVDPQTIIVEKYTTNPNNVAVGFYTEETLVNATQDSSLYENALGVPNERAPGADRLKLAPKLRVVTKEQAAANDEFFTLVEWNDGYPYKQNRVTQYSRLGDAIAESQYDSTGNFVMDAFQVTTESVANSAKEGTYYTCVVDPGQGYIGGRKVQTLSNYKIDVTKGLDTKTSNNIISLNYGNYIRVNELAGNFDFSGGGTVNFYGFARKYISNTSNIYGATISVSDLGPSIGTAKIRSLELESGTPGTIDAVYRLYIFDLQMSSGKNFRDVKSVYYDGASYDGIADVVLSFDASTSSNVAIIQETKFNSLIFSAGVESLKNSNNSTYTYRTSQTAPATISTGRIAISLDGGSDEYFPYVGTLSGSQMQDIVVIPTHASLVSTNLTGTLTINTASNTIIGSSTDFLSAFEVGDYIQVANASSTNIRRIVAIANTTSLTIDTAPTVANTSTGTFKRAFPINVPVPFGRRTGLSANVDLSTEKTLTLQFAHANGTAIAFDYGSSTSNCHVSFDVERRNVASSLKTAVRNKYVKIRVANSAPGNTASVKGPWCIGVPDAFRLRAVYIGNSSVNTSFSDVTTSFYIDHNQNANYMGLGYLYKDPKSNLTISESDYILVCFDYFTRDNAGYYDTRSYLRTATAANVATIDSYTFDQLRQSPSSSSWEIPEVYTYDNDYYDLSNQFDFRPTCDATATPAATVASAPVNPSETITFTGLSKFPKPNAVMKTQVEQYLGRMDDVYIGESSNIYIMKGIPDVNPRRRYLSNHPKDSLKLQTINVPPYPCIARTRRNSTQAIIDTRVKNEKSLNLRLKTRTIYPVITQASLQISQPMIYTMEDIGNLERRIKDLEYYVSLSLLETNITNRVIPSSIDPSINRFKFGFFADDFSTDLYSDVNNPQYAASIEVEGEFDFGFSGDPFSANTSSVGTTNPVSTSIPQPTKVIAKATNRLVPPKHIWSLKHITENLYYVDEPIIEQLNATVVVNPCVVDIPANDETKVGKAYYTSVNKRTSSVYLEDLPGIVTVYFQIYGTANTVIGTKFTIRNKAGTVVASTAATRNDVKLLTKADIDFLTTSDRAKEFYNAINPNQFTTNFTRNTSFADYGFGSGKIEFSGVENDKYTIEADAQDVDANYKILVSFPSIYSADSNIVNNPACDPSPPRWEGTLAAGKFTIVQWSCSNAFRVNATGYKAFILEATGLKPNTIHKLYLDTEVWQNVILLNQALFDASKYEPRRSSKKDKEIGAETLVLSRNNKVNELGRLLNLAMQKLYNPDGSPTNATILKSNEFGKIRVLVFFPLSVARWFSQDFNAQSYRLDYTGYESSEYGKPEEKPTQGSQGYTMISLENEDRTSIAKRVFANRTPIKIIPPDAKGNI